MAPRIEIKLKLIAKISGKFFLIRQDNTTTPTLKTMPNLKANQIVSSQVPSLTILWQNDPASWQLNSDTIASQFLGLMGNDPTQSWDLVLDIVGPLNTNAGSWNQTTLLALLNSLAKLGMQPNLIFHPDGEKATQDWIKYNPKDTLTQQDLEDEWTAMVTNMVNFNKAIAAENSTLPNTSIKLPLFTSFLAEGNDFSPLNGGTKKDTFTYLNNLLQTQGIKNTKPWNTGDWLQGIALTVNGDGSPDPKTPDSGVYMQIYDFYGNDDPNKLIGQPTDPSQPTILGKQMVDWLQNQANPPMNPWALVYPNRAPQIFNFSGQDQGSGKINDAPVFGGLGQEGVAKGEAWDIKTFNEFLKSYETEFEIYSKSKQPTLGIWAAENALNVLVPPNSSLARHENAFSSIASENENDLLVNKYQQNLLFNSNKGGKLVFNLEVCAALRSGIGIYPLLDNDARIVSPQGKILSVSDSEYLANAKQLAIETNNWFADTRPAGDVKAQKFSWDVQLNPNQRYALIADSDLQTSGALYSSINFANFDKKIQFAPSTSNPNKIIGFEDLINGDNDFNDIKLEIPNIENILFNSSSLFTSSPIGLSNLAPEIDVLWQDASALDEISAYQIAQLITGNPNNTDLKLIINISGPNSIANPTPSDHQGTPPIKNTPEQLVAFINKIDFYVKELSGSWSGPIAYHPDATYGTDGDFIHDWSGASGTAPIAGKSPIGYTLDTTDSYKAYIDYLTVLNLYLLNGTTSKRSFNEFVFEYENSQFAQKNKKVPESTLFGAEGLFRSYAGQFAGNPDIINSGNPLKDITLSATSSLLENWDSQYNRAGWGADSFYAQVYDLVGDSDYNPSWNGQLNPGAPETNPTEIMPSEAVKAFNNFFATTQNAINPRQQINNINRMVTPQASSTTPATAFDPRANFIFSYGPDSVDGPVFYSTTPESKWQWDANEFALFLGSSTDTNASGLRNTLPGTLDTIAQGYGGISTFGHKVGDFKLGVWGAERALDAWFVNTSPSELGRLHFTN